LITADEVMPVDKIVLNKKVPEGKILVVAGTPGMPAILLSFLLMGLLFL